MNDFTCNNIYLNTLRLDGITIHKDELKCLDNISSNIQTQLNLQAPLASPTFTGMTTSYLTSFIQSVAGAMTSLLNPVGSVVAFAGSSAPSGWLMCDGALISKTTYASLWAVIGNTYLNGRSADANNYYLPDLREMYIKGAGQNFTYSKKYTYSGGNALGTFLDQSVFDHYHTYTDKGDGTVSRTTGPNTSANDNQRTNEKIDEIHEFHIFYRFSKFQFQFVSF